MGLALGLAAWAIVVLGTRPGSKVATPSGGDTRGAGTAPPAADVAGGGPREERRAEAPSDAMPGPPDSRAAAPPEMEAGNPATPSELPAYAHLVSTNLSGESLVVLNWNGFTTYAERSAAIGVLRQRALRPADVAALYAFLRNPDAGGTGALEVNALRNDVLDLLLERRPLPAGLDQLTLELAGEANLDPVWRNYVVQHLPALVEALAVPGGSRAKGAASATPEEPSVIGGKVRALLDPAVADPASAMSGTALLTILRLAESGQVYALTEVRERAWSLLQTGGELAASVSALQVLGRLKVAEAAPVAMTVIRSSEADLAHRLAAVGTLRAVAPQRSETRRLFVSLSGSDAPPPLRAAAAAALKQMAAEARTN